MSGTNRAARSKHVRPLARRLLRYLEKQTAADRHISDGNEGKMKTYLPWITLGLLAVTTADAFAQNPSVWPGSNWDEVHPAEVGMRLDPLNQSRDYALSAGGSGMIVRHGKSVIRWGDQEQRYDIKSASKSVGVTALGLAIKDGLIRLEDKAASHHFQFGIPPDSNADRGWLSEINDSSAGDADGWLRETRGLRATAVQTGHALALQRRRSQLAGRMCDVGLRARR